MRLLYKIVEFGKKKNIYIIWRVIKKNSYERRFYESADDRSLFQTMSRPLEGYCILLVYILM